LGGILQPREPIRDASLKLGAGFFGCGRIIILLPLQPIGASLRFEFREGFFGSGLLRLLRLLGGILQPR
jgi:hypothetical protein